MKVLHLPYGIGISVLSRALRLQGVDAISYSLRPHHYAYMADVQMNFNKYTKKKRRTIFRKAMKKYDVFHFHFGETFFPNKRDLKKLANKNKKMVVHHRGSEARMLTVARSFNNPYVQVKRKWSEKKIRKHLKRLSKYIDQAIVPDHELASYVKPYYKKVHVVPHAIDLKKFSPYYPLPNQRPLLVHAPSNNEIKGTKFIQSSVDRLRKEGFEFDFKLIKNMSHKKALRLYQRATIIIDQLRIGSYANLSIEAMAMGKPVICYIRDDLRNTFPRELPIVNANPDTIYDVLSDLLKHPETWERLGKKGRRYVEQHHSMEKVALSLIDIYNQL